MRKVRALRDDVIVKVHHKDKVGSIFFPTDTAKEYNADFYGEVISVGKKYKYDVHVGDKVIFTRHEGKRITVDGEKYLVLKSRWVLGTIEED